MGERGQKSVALLLWPFYAIWRLLTLILQVTGRIICGILGLAIMVAGTTLIITIAGAPLGIPLTIFGFLVLVRALF